jgi:hypothetical protein
MKANVKYFSYDIARSVTHLIKTGSVLNIGEALNYSLIKTGLTFDKADDKIRSAWNNLVKELREYNGDNSVIYNAKANFTFQAKNKKTALSKMEKGLTFARADLQFDLYKRAGAWTNVLLLEGSSRLREYTEASGEERSVRYEALNGLSRILTAPENMAYKTMEVETSYIYHQDSGHGWLEVPAGEIIAMGLTEKITPYSYLRQGKAYLEEDVDMETFLNLRKLLPQAVDVKINYLDGMSLIRDYPQYKSENNMPEKNSQDRKKSSAKNIGWER